MRYSNLLGRLKVTENAPGAKISQFLIFLILSMNYTHLRTDYIFATHPLSNFIINKAQLLDSALFKMTNNN